MPSPEDLEAVAEENTAVLLEDMAGENSEAVRKAQEDSERAETESEAGTEYVETLAGVPTGEIYSEKALMDYDSFWDISIQWIRQHWQIANLLTERICCKRILPLIWMEQNQKF